MTMSIELFEALLLRKIGEPVEVYQSEILRDFVRVIRKDKKRFTRQQQRELNIYSTPGTLKNIACYHILVGENLLNQGIVVV